MTVATLSRETLIPVKDVPKVCPGRPNLRTVWRWISVGVSGTRLEVIRVGGRVFTSEDAIQRFLKQLNAN